MAFGEQRLGAVGDSAASYGLALKGTLDLAFHWCPLLVKSKQKPEVLEVTTVKRIQMGGGGVRLV